jgi:hypothetical protein
MNAMQQTSIKELNERYEETGRAIKIKQVIREGIKQIVFNGWIKQ